MVVSISGEAKPELLSTWMRYEVAPLTDDQSKVGVASQVPPIRLVSLKAAWFMLGWNFIYYVRARTEERHLSLDPNYRAYMKHVRWRFIPGVW